MSDYGDDYSDYGGEEWFYVEEEYMAADDLAEHAVASPPPTYLDEDILPDWDRFDYFNDLEYASDGYDDANFAPHNAEETKIGQKRKRVVTKDPGRKRRAIDTALSQVNTSQVDISPVVWRSHADREVRPRLLDKDAKSYALLKNWREKLADTPRWARGSPPASPSMRDKPTASHVPDPVSPPSDIDLIDPEPEHVDDELEEGEGLDISQEALMAALQRQLAAAGGPLSGMDPQQLLDFAMRMATGKDDGDNIAGEMADAMLDGDDEEDDADAEENLLSWVAQQRNASNGSVEEALKSPDAASNSKRPPTPPSSEANRSVRASATTSKTVQSNATTSSLKRKADEDADADAEGSTKVVKKRVTRSFDAPTAASQARATSAKNARSKSGKKS